MAALTCIDARLNPLFPEVLGLPKEQFIWLRNAGNIITGPDSSTMRSLALACVVKGAKEIAIIGHSDCQVSKSSVMKLTDAFRAMGVARSALPENLTEFFGLFASERQNVIKAAEFVRHSPLIGPKVPVHGLVVDIGTGKLEWIVNGYHALELAAAQPKRPPSAPGPGSHRRVESRRRIQARRNEIPGNQDRRVRLANAGFSSQRNRANPAAPARTWPNLRRRMPAASTAAAARATSRAADSTAAPPATGSQPPEMAEIMIHGQSHTRTSSRSCSATPRQRPRLSFLRLPDRLSYFSCSWAPASSWRCVTA